MKLNLITVPAAAALALALSAPAANAADQFGVLGRVFGVHVQHQDRDRDHDRDRDRDWNRGRYDSVAFNNGYREGLDHGRDAARHHRRFDPDREKDFRKADEGYRREYGPKDWYRDQFRRGFQQGYERGYREWAR
jgi:hypothetical protein